MADSKLESSHQVFIVQQLAMFERPVDVQEALKQNFEIDISLQAVCHYDISNPKLSKKLKILFSRTRKKFLDDSSKIPIANKSYRLKILQKQLDTELDQKPVLQNKKAQREILEQAAKESGDAFSNKQKVEVSDPEGKSLIPTSITVNVVKSDSIIKDEQPDD